MARTFGLIVLFLAAILGGLWLSATTSTAPPARPAGPAGLGGDFTLMGDRGPVSLHNFKDKVVVVSYGYTSCPDVCPLTLSIITSALKALSPEELSQVQALFITLDPERDTPARTAEYAGHFHPNIMGLSGTPEQIAQVAKQYLVIYRKVPMPDSALGYALDHSARMYVLDRNGNYADSATHLTSPQDLLAKIRATLQQ